MGIRGGWLALLAMVSMLCAGSSGAWAGTILKLTGSGSDQSSTILQGGVENPTLRLSFFGWQEWDGEGMETPQIVLDAFAIDVSRMVLVLLGNAGEDNIEAVRLYRDDGDSTFDAGDVSIAQGKLANGRVTFTASPLFSIGSPDWGANGFVVRLHVVVVPTADASATGLSVGVSLRGIFSPWLLLDPSPDVRYNFQAGTEEDQFIGDPSASMLIRFEGSPSEVGPPVSQSILSAGEGAETFRLRVIGAADDTWTSLALTFAGEAPPSDLSLAVLYRQGPGDTGILDLGDLSIAQATLSPGGMLTFSVSEAITPGLDQWYLITLTLADSLSSGQNSVRLSLASAAWIQLSGGSASANSPVASREFYTDGSPVVSGVVRDANGPLSGVRLTITGDTLASVTTDVNGRYRYVVNKGLTLTVAPVQEGMIFSPGRFMIQGTQGNHPQDFLGTTVTVWGSFGSAGGAFDAPWGVARDREGNVYVADTGNHRVQKFSDTGAFLTAWGSFGTGEGQFKTPQGLAVDMDGRLYVADTGNHRVQKFTGSGVFLTMWGRNGGTDGSSGNGEGELSSPYDVAVDAEGHVFVTDSANNRIQKFTSSGGFLAAFSVSGGIRGIAVNSQGELYVVERSSDRVRKWSADGVFQSITFGSSGAGEGEFGAPWAVAVDAEGNLYVTDSGHDKVQKFSADGTALQSWGREGLLSGFLDDPVGVALDAGRGLIVAEGASHRVQRWSQEGLTLSTVSGTVSGEGTGDPMDGVSLVAFGGSMQDHTVTQGGSYQLTLASGTWVVSAFKGGMGFSPMRLTVTVDGESAGAEGVNFTGFEAETLAVVSNLGLQPPAKISPGVQDALMRLSFNVNTGEVVWNRLSLSLIGEAAPEDIAAVRLYRGTGAADASWEATDVSLASASFHPARWATLEGFEETLTASQANLPYFLVMEVARGVMEEKSAGFTLTGPSNFGATGGVSFASFLAVSGFIGEGVSETLTVALYPTPEVHRFIRPGEKRMLLGDDRKRFTGSRDPPGSRES